MFVAGAAFKLRAPERANFNQPSVKSDRNGGLSWNQRFESRLKAAISARMPSPRSKNTPPGLNTGHRPRTFAPRLWLRVAITYARPLELLCRKCRKSVAPGFVTGGVTIPHLTAFVPPPSQVHVISRQTCGQIRQTVLYSAPVRRAFSKIRYRCANLRR